MIDETDGYENITVFTPLKQYVVLCILNDLVTKFVQFAPGGVSDIRNFSDKAKPSSTSSGDCKMSFIMDISWS